MDDRIFQDPQTGRYYRVNPQTGMTQWVDEPSSQGRGQQQPSMQSHVVTPQQFGAGLSHQEPPRSRRIPGWLLVGGGLVVGLVIGSNLGSGDGATITAPAAASQPAQTETTAADPKAADPKAADPKVIVIQDAKTFGDAFDANKVAAEKEWNGKRIQLTAKVINIKEDRIVLSDVTTKFSLTQVSCELSNREQALTLKNDSKATVVGTVDGQSFTVVTLKDCEVEG